MIPGKARMYTHRLFTIDYNEDRIVKVDMTSSNLKVVEKDTYIQFSCFILDLLCLQHLLSLQDRILLSRNDLIVTWSSITLNLKFTGLVSSIHS